VDVKTLHHLFTELTAFLPEMTYLFLKKAYCAVMIIITAETIRSAISTCDNNPLLT
jgi:hypothetical protein